MLRPDKGIGLLPLQFLLKNQLHFTATDMARFFAIAAISWYLKPLAGMLSDHFPIFGSRSHIYLISGATATAALWLWIGFGPHTRYALLGAITVLSTVFVVSAATMNGLVVAGGREFAATGRLSSVRRVAEYVAAFVVGPIGGWLASRRLELTGTICAGFALVLALMILFNRTDSNDSRPTKSLVELRASFVLMVRSKPMWMAGILFFLLSLSPGFQTPLFYYKSNTLHFSAQFIGTLALVQAAFSIVASASYAWLCTKASLRTLIAWAVVLDAFAQGLYVFYASPESALLIEALAGLMRGFVWMPILDLLVRAVPRGNEAVGAALEWTPANVAVAISDLTGAWLYEQYGMSFKNLAWLNMGTTLLILFIVPLIPASVMAIREGHLAESPAG
jgi:Na+/melibiose symporter-like transporter